jgi:hypothetical protein
MKTGSRHLTAFKAQRMRTARYSIGPEISERTFEMEDRGRKLDLSMILGN